MTRHLTLPTRRRFLQTASGFAATAAALGRRPTEAEAARAQGPALRIRAVDAYPIYINQRSDGLLDAPTFSGDDDPRRWRWGGPFEQLPSAIIAIIKTEQGVTGFGMGAGGSAAVEIIDGHLKHLLMGADPLNVEQLWDQMYQSAIFYGRRGVFAMALSAVDNALWDIAGKHAGQPVHELLGGASRDRIPLYQTGGDVAAGVAAGVRNFKRSLPVNPLTPADVLDRAIDSVLEARDVLGPDGNLMTDCVSRNGTVDWAVGVAERLRPAGLYFMEEMLSPDDVFGYAELVRRIGGGGPGWTRVACGEHEYTEHGFEVLVRLGSAERSSSPTSRGAAAPPPGGASRGSSRRRGSRSSPTAAPAPGGSPSRSSRRAAPWPRAFPPARRSSTQCRRRWRTARSWPPPSRASGRP